MKFALIKELKATGDARVLFSPKQLALIIQKYPQHEFIVESSDIRAFKDKQYTDLGIPVVTNTNDADVFLGIKEVPLKALIPNKTYFFFSHTTKMQLHNKQYLQGLHTAKITFYDYENFIDNNNRRLISFGENAGQIGAYQAIRAYGLKNTLFKLPKPSSLNSFNELYKNIKTVKLPPIKIVVTGTGNVGKGINKLLTFIGIQQINPNDFLNPTYDQPVFTQLSKKDYLAHIEKGNYSEEEFLNDPTKFKSTFLKFAKEAQLFISGHYNHTKMPLFFTKEEIKHSNFSINTIGDISCDIKTPLPTCLRASTPNNPIYGYHKTKKIEYNYLSKDCIAVMAVDNLPCELARETSTDFGNQFSSKILDHLMTNFNHPVLEKACVLKNGEFTQPYKYLEHFILKKN